MSEAPLSSRADKGSARDLANWAQLQPTVGRCAFCPEWTVAGTAAEVRELCAAHRQEIHPELTGVKKRRPKANLMRWRTVLDEDATTEIADTRSKRMKLLGIPDTEAAP